MRLNFFSHTLLCGLIFFRTYSAVPLNFFFRTYSAVPLNFFFRTYSAVRLNFFSRLPCCALEKFFFRTPCCALFPLLLTLPCTYFSSHLPRVKGRYRRTNILPTYVKDKLRRENEGEPELSIYTTKVVLTVVGYRARA